LLDDLDISELDRRISDLAKKGLDLLDGAGAVFKRIGYQFALDMSYLGQTHTVDVPLLLEFDGKSTEISVIGIRDAFENRYRQVYGRPVGVFVSHLHCLINNRAVQNFGYILFV